MQFAELRRLGVESAERVLRGNVVHTGLEVVAENAGENVRFDERGVNDRPNDDTAYRGERDGESRAVREDTRKPVGVRRILHRLGDFIEKDGQVRGKTRYDHIEDPGENAADQQKREQPDTEDPTHIFGKRLTVLEEEDGALAGRLPGVHFLAEEDPTEAAVA